MILPTALLTLLWAGDPIALWQAGELAGERIRAVAPSLAEVRAALAAERLEAARQAAARAALVAPQRADAWLLLGLALFRAERFAEAEPAFAAASSLEPTGAAARFDLASARFEAGRFEAAESTYLEAAALDPRVRPLALLDAGRAALQAGRFDAAERHLKDARATEGSSELTGRVDELLAEVATKRAAQLTEQLRARAHAGREALHQGRVSEAITIYRATLSEAEAAGAPADARAELAYALGLALRRAGQAAAAAQAAAQAVALVPGDADFVLLYGLALADAGDDPSAERVLTDALRRGLDASDAEHAREVLERARERRRASARLQVEARVGGGYDSNVPQSSVVVTAPGQTAATAPGAGQLHAALDVGYRAAGTPQTGLTLRYRFDQLAYLSAALDPYSLQEHDLELNGVWTPRPWLSLELAGQAYLLLTGVQTFGLFQVGGTIGTRVIFHEGHGLETRVRYDHTFQRSLDSDYDYLTGGRDDLAVSEWWRGKRARASLGYRLTRDAVGTQSIDAAELNLPPSASPPPGAYYLIPNSFLSHEVSLSGRLELGWSVAAALTLRYAHAGYDDPTRLLERNGTTDYQARPRIDDRFVVDASLVRPIWGPLGFEVAYTLLVNTSTIANHQAATHLDYDDKNFLRHVVEVQVDYLY